MEGVSFEIANTVETALAAGRSPVQAYREWRGYDIMALALASGVPAGIIAEHEATRCRLSQANCDAIGGALDVPCELLQN